MKLNLGSFFINYNIQFGCFVLFFKNRFQCQKTLHIVYYHHYFVVYIYFWFILYFIDLICIYVYITC